jgi:hypothetical protein
MCPSQFPQMSVTAVLGAFEVSLGGIIFRIRRLLYTPQRCFPQQTHDRHQITELHVGDKK